MELLLPPKAKALQSTVSTSFSRAWLNTTSRSQSGSRSLKCKRGGQDPMKQGQDGRLGPQHPGGPQAVSDR